MTTDDHKTQSYRWALYVLLVILGYFLGRAKEGNDRWLYIGPDTEKANSAVISFTTNR